MKQDLDWRVHQSRLYMHDNYKFQSVYTRRPEPVVQQIKDNETLADMLIFVGCLCVVCVLIIAAVLKFLPALQLWLMT